MSKQLISICILLGICFGHQIIAMALGGTCVNNNKTWEVGPTAVKLNDLGKKIFGIDREELVCLILFSLIPSPQG